MCRSSPSVILTSPISRVETRGAWSTRTPISPSAILATTRSASPSKIISSGVMIRQKSCLPSRLSSRGSATLAYLPGLADLPRRGRLLVLSGLPGLLGLLIAFGLLGTLVLLGFFSFLFTAQAPGLLDGLIYVADE